MSSQIAPPSWAEPEPCFITRRLFEVCGCSEYGFVSHDKNCARNIELRMEAEPNMSESMQKKHATLLAKASKCKGVFSFWQVDETICPYCEPAEEKKVRITKPGWLSWFQAPPSPVCEAPLEFDDYKMPQSQINRRIANWDGQIALQRDRRAKQEAQEKKLRDLAWAKQVREQEIEDVENAIPVEDRMVLVRPVTPPPVPPKQFLRGFCSRS